MSDRKKVVVEITFTMLREVPAEWDEDMVNFYFNEGSHCLSTELADLAQEETLAETGCCFTCLRAEAAYVRDAESHDIENLTPEKGRK